jgi:hypothetical protein
MNKLLNGFNNGRDTSDGIGGKSFQEINKGIKTNNMEKNKYVVINSEDIQKRIEELKESDILKQWKKDTETHNGHSPQQSRQKAIIEVEINTLEQILSNSKPLTPIIENALKEGMLIQRTINDKVKIPATRIKDYINNLKLDI